MVASFEELVQRPLRDGVNAVCWPRVLSGDFNEVARLLAPPDGMVSVHVDMLRRLPLSSAGSLAADMLLEDLQRLDALGLEPELNCITRYASDDRGLPIAADVMSFHADRAPIEVATWLCTYAGRTSEGLDNDDAFRLIDDPVIRTELRAASACATDETFQEFLREGSFDLHYRAVRGRSPFSFGVGHLWRIAVNWPGSPVPPCIHRAPRTDLGEEPRLLLIC